jgi:hypothetical protein
MVGVAESMATFHGRGAAFNFGGASQTAAPAL